MVRLYLRDRGTDTERDASLAASGPHAEPPYQCPGKEHHGRGADERLERREDIQRSTHAERRHHDLVTDGAANGKECRDAARSHPSTA